MSMMRRVLLGSLLAAIAIAAFGCSGDSGSDKDADALYEEGMTELESEMSSMDPETPPWEWDVDVSDAYEHFDDAANADPAHCGALLMSAATRLLMVITDPELAGILDGLFPEEPEAQRATALFWYMRKPDFPNLAKRLSTMDRQDLHFSELQDYIEDEALPALAYADARFTDFEEYDCVVIVPVETDSVDLEIELDATDAYFLHTALDAIQIACNMAVAYNVDIDDGQTPEELIESDANFLTLRNSGALPDAYDRIAGLADHLNAGCDALEAETDDQTNDVVTLTDGYIPLEEIMGPEALEAIRDVADGIDDALVNGVSFNPSDDDPAAPDVDVLIDLDELFNDPIADIRDYLPAHDWPNADSMNVHRPIDFPDPTFDDITPGMSDAEWELLIQWMED